METPRKYIALRWIGVIATVAAWLVVALGVIGLLWVLANVGANWARTLLVVLVLVWGVSTFLTFFVRGNVLLLLCDLEQRARADAQALDQMRGLLQSAMATAAQTAAMRGPSQTGSTSPDSEATRIQSRPTLQGDTKPAEPKKSDADSEPRAAST